MNKVVASAIASIVVATVVYAAEPWPDRVVVVGQRIGGGNVICRGMGCASILQEMQDQARINLELDTQYAALEDPPVSGTQFCSALRNSKPAGCSLSSPPPSPGLGTNWQPNGCGTGRLQRMFLDRALEGAATHTYSGDVDAPYPGVSFLAACNAHDLCYAVAGGKDNCDLTFRNNMVSACSSAGNNAVCQGWASNYHGAVSTLDAARSAYITSTSERSCALWAKDMQENGC